MKIIQEIDRQKWSHFVYNNIYGNIFQTPEMHDVFRDTKNNSPIFFAAVDDDNNLLGVLLALIQKTYPGFIGKFTSRAIVWGGPIVKNNNSEIAKYLLENFDRAVREKVIYSEFRNLWDTKDFQKAFKNCHYNYEEHLNILVDLTIGEEALWRDLSKARKEGIRKARRNNLIFEATHSKEIISTFYELLRETYKHAKLPFPSVDFFFSLYNKLAPDHIKFFTIRKGGKFLVILLALVFKDCLYAYYIGTVRDNEYLKMKPVDLLYWEVMVWGLKNGYKIFDWLGAGKPNQEYGVRKFKQQFGGKLVELGRYKRVFNPFLMYLAKLALKLWKRFH